jgi:coniferyl-aldehyde dehydrogenase
MTMTEIRSHVTSKDEMRAQLERMKAAQLKDGTPSAEVRIARLDAAIGMIVANQDALIQAVREDFGHRSNDQTAFADLVSSIAALKNSRKHLRKWMRTENRGVEFPLGLLGAKSRLHYQPKGVVGIVAPWNFPVGMVFTPLAGIFAAGNRAIAKPSEFTPRTSALMAELIGKHFDRDVFTCFTGEADVGALFTSLPFDHIIFTGSTHVGRHVMRAAAENLTPVTLELGGKSPTIVSDSANLEQAALRIMHGKTLNAGQICTAPDYVLVPKGTERAFVTQATRAVETMYPAGLKDNEDYTSIVNQRHLDRLKGLIEDARAKGAEVVEINPKGEDFSQQPAYKLPPTLLLNTTDDMAVMKEEIFGPVMPVRGVDSIDAAIAEINARPRPLALYYFGNNAAERDRVLNQTVAGGVTINDTIFHVAQEDLPFGGVGPSGMGHYHGREGFLEFSHAKAVFHQTSSNLLKMFFPPYGKTFRSQVAGRLKA